MLVTFKSTPENYAKELDGRKCNTCRNTSQIAEEDADYDYRFVALDEFMEKPFDLNIQIVNTETNESFTRKVTDVTIWEEICIISWKAILTQNSVLKIIDEYKNPYPNDIFMWNNKEKLNITKGRFNEFVWKVVENTREEIKKQIKEEEE